MKLEEFFTASERECIDDIVTLTYPDGTTVQVNADDPIDWAGIQIRMSESVGLDPGYTFTPGIGFVVHPARLQDLTALLRTDMASARSAMESAIMEQSDG